MTAVGVTMLFAASSLLAATACAVIFLQRRRGPSFWISIALGVLSIGCFLAVVWNRAPFASRWHMAELVLGLGANVLGPAAIAILGVRAARASSRRIWLPVSLAVVAWATLSVSMGAMIGCNLDIACS